MYSVPTRQQQNEISYSIQGTQQKFQPISFLVSANQENIQPSITTYTTEEEDQSMFSSPYQTYNSQVRTRPYGEETTTTTTTTYSQQQPRSTGLMATVAKQPGPTYSYYQQPTSQETDRMQTETETSEMRLIRSTQQPQPSTTSYYSTRPSFTKVYKIKT